MGVEGRSGKSETATPASLLEIYPARRPGFSACFFGDITKMCRRVPSNSDIKFRKVNLQSFQSQSEFSPNSVQIQTKFRPNSVGNLV
jgi:hypothetical protein